MLDCEHHGDRKHFYFSQPCGFGSSTMPSTEDASTKCYRMCTYMLLLHLRVVAIAPLGTWKRETMGHCHSLWASQSMDVIKRIFCSCQKHRFVMSRHSDSWDRSSRKLTGQNFRVVDFLTGILMHDLHLPDSNSVNVSKSSRSFLYENYNIWQDGELNIQISEFQNDQPIDQSKRILLPIN